MQQREKAMSWDNQGGGGPWGNNGGSGGSGSPWGRGTGAKEVANTSRY